MHEDALVALQAKAAHVFGQFDGYGHYSTPRSGDSEQDFEQDAIGALRLPGVASRGQLARSRATSGSRSSSSSDRCS